MNATPTTNEPVTQAAPTPVAPMTDRTIHNETNFRPEEYTVLDYLDNRQPAWRDFCPMVMFGAAPGVYQGMIDRARERYEAALRLWNEQMDKYFPHRRQQQPSIHKCTHCGNTQVRYIVAVKHLPTGQNVVFGDVCVERLGFANYESFKAAQVRARAAQGNANLAVFKKREKFLADHQEFAALISNVEELSHPDHARNAFAADIIAKFNKYGSLSDAQVSAFVTSLQRDHEYAQRRAQQATIPRGDVPTGRTEFTGEIIKIKTYDPNHDGRTGHKLTLKLDNNSRVWVTSPNSLNLEQYPVGSFVTLKATVTASRDDRSFGFGKRPTLVRATRTRETLPSNVNNAMAA